MWEGRLTKELSRSDWPVGLPVRYFLNGFIELGRLTLKADCSVP